MRIEIDPLQYLELTGSPGKPVGISSNLKNEDPTCDEDVEWNLRIDAIESLVLAHYCAGVDVRAPAYVAGLRTAVEAIENHS